jgi:EAL domain-containing protein (putative c-di-GMP-specific phosphodiesterase class I)
VESAVVKMQALGKVGVRFSVDDFGTGYSSLAILTRLPISKLKIDQSFVRNLGCRKKDEIIVKTIVGMAHSLGLTVIAEGVETLLQHDQLTGYECDLFQGYLFGRAQPRQDLERALEVQHADETSALEHQQF